QGFPAVVDSPWMLKKISVTLTRAIYSVERGDATPTADQAPGQGAPSQAVRRSTAPAGARGSGTIVAVSRGAAARRALTVRSSSMRKSETDTSWAGWPREGRFR